MISASQTVGTPPLEVSFIGSDSFDPEDTTLSYFWEFGDGSVSQIANPTHQFLEEGTFEVKLTVSDTDGLSNSATIPITVAELRQGLLYEYYEIDDLNLLPDFDAHLPVESGEVRNVTLEPRRKDSDFSFRFRGGLAIETAGLYTFFTESDDGSRLLIDGQLIVDNNGTHGPIW